MNNINLDSYDEQEKYYNYHYIPRPSFKDVWTLEKIKGQYTQSGSDLYIYYVSEFYNLNRVIKRIQRKFIEKLYNPNGVFYCKIKNDFAKKINTKNTHVI